MPQWRADAKVQKSASRQMAQLDRVRGARYSIMIAGLSYFETMSDRATNELRKRRDTLGPWGHAYEPAPGFWTREANGLRNVT
jgi:hypothetical protein